MTISTISTISMNGNSTGYGSAVGTEVFNLAGYYNTVQLAGANDTVNVGSGLFDSIDLDSTGFTNAVTDAINLGASAFDRIGSSHALMGANVTITASGGPNTIALVNHGGNTAISLGYVGDPALQGSGLGNVITLNGDAANVVDLLAGGSATIGIGTAGDGLLGYASAVTMTGVGNVLTGGDEAFTVVNAASTSNTVSLGDGANTVSLSGAHNSVALGDGNNVLAYSGGINTAVLGTGSNVVNLSSGSDTLAFAAGGASAQDSINLHADVVHMQGGDENFDITGTARNSFLSATLGNGNNTVNMAFDGAHLVLGHSIANTGHNSVILQDGGLTGTFNGGVDTITTNNIKSPASDRITLNGTMLGTQLTSAGAFDSLTLSNDANATINDTGLNGDMSITLDGDAHQGFGTIAITGLSHDDLAQIHLVNAGSYTVTTDDTALGGITLHFAQGSVDLVGLQSVPNHLFG